VTKPVVLDKLRTGVAGLDDVLGGGLVELSFNLIAGGPGTGKTTLAHQIMFTTATPACPALYITILGEPPIKMLRYQQQYTFFDEAMIPDRIRFLHLGSDLLDHGLARVLASIINEVEATSPRLVFVDSFRSIIHKSMQAGEVELQSFVQKLALQLTSWEATTFLIGEYEERDAECNPIFTVADGIFWLSQATDRNSVVRKLQIVKMRGQSPIPGLHTLKISNAGVRVYPRLPNPERARQATSQQAPRRKTGVAELDAMLGGGIPAGYSVMIVGPSGSGKTILSTQFIRDGIAHGERGVIAVFEKRPDEYLLTAPGAQELGQLIEAGMLEVLYLRPLDLSVDETLEEIVRAVTSTGATRVVIDSLMGLELALAPAFREDFRESLYRMVGALVGLGVTVVITAELVDSYTELRLSPHGISFLTDGIILQRYLELEGVLTKVLVIAKMRGIDHSKELRLYDITADGLVIGEPLANRQGVLVGKPRRLPNAD
jgi:circadian clock protein KaiC